MSIYFDQGTYDCIIRRTGLGESKEKKTPCVFIVVVPVKCDRGELPEGYEREVQLWLTDKTLERTVEQLRALGWTGDSFKDFEPGSGFTLKGVNIKVRCEHEEFVGTDGETVRVERWKLPSGGQQSEHKQGMAKKLDAMFGKELKKTASVKSKAVKETVPADDIDGVEPDDEVPF